MGSNYILWIWSENLAPQNFCSAQSPRAGHCFLAPLLPRAPAHLPNLRVLVHGQSKVQGVVSSDQFFFWSKVNYDIICAGLACFVSTREKAGCLLIDRLPSRCRPAEGLEKPNTLRCNFTSRQPFWPRLCSSCCELQLAKQCHHNIVVNIALFWPALILDTVRLDCSIPASGLPIAAHKS